MTLMKETQSQDLRHLLSKEARKRKPSPIKTTMAYFEDPKMVFLGAGMPPAELFPINSLTFEFPVTGGSGDEKATRSGVISRLAADRELETDVPLSRALQYGNSRGQRELVGFLKEHIRRFHKIGYQDWDLITTTGSTQGWDASLRVFCDAGDSVLLEEYTYSSTLEAAEAQGHYCVGMEIDKDGIIPARLEYLLENWNELHPGRKRPKVLNTIPTGQNPTGRTLVDERKPEIYRIAQRFDMIIVEDDPYYFLQMDKYKLPGEREPHETDYDSKAAYWTEHHEEFISSLTRSFLEWDTDGRVIRLDSVTKTFAPGCRLGWLVGPKWLLDQYWNLHEVSIQSTCGFSQTIINGILNRWGQDGYINWLIHVRMEYTRKRDHCLDCCYKYLPLSFVNVSAPLAGMFFMIHFDSEKHPEFSTVFDSNPRKLEAHIYAKFIEQGVLMACGTWFQVDRTSTDNTMLAFRGTFASPNAESMDFGIKKVAEVIRNEFKLSIA